MLINGPFLPQVDGVTYEGEGRSKKQAKLVAAKNALRTFLEQQQQTTSSFCAPTVPFAPIEYNRGALVDVDFTSDDPTDANFIIDTMNRIQTAPNLLQMPLSALPGNNGTSAMKPPPSKSGEPTSPVLLCRNGGGKENHDDSGHVGGEDDLELSLSPIELRNEESGDEEDQEDVEVTLEIQEIIRTSVEHYIDYDSEIQSK